MTTIDAIRMLYAYSAWANGRVLDSAAKLDTETFLAAQPPNGDSAGRLLSHVMWAQWLWLSRWGGIAPPPRIDAAYADASSLRDRWRRVQRHTETFLMDLDDGAIEREISYVNSAGEAWTYPLWQQLLHVANHATQHRSEAAAILTSVGHSPGQLDLLVYVDQLTRSP